MSEAKMEVVRRLLAKAHQCEVAGEIAAADAAGRAAAFVLSLHIEEEEAHDEPA